MATQRGWNAHPHLAWAAWGLDEIEATLASIESRIRKHAGVHPRAEGAVADMRTARDAFRKSIEEHARTDDAALARTREALERQWTTFEDSVQAYLEAVDKQLTEQKSVFRARADAQSQAWQQAIDNLHNSVARLASERPVHIETAVKHLDSEADAAKIKLDRLNAAEGASWEAMRSALTETRAALDHAHRSVLDTLERS